MPLMQPTPELAYFLLNFDADGREVPEAGGALLSAAILAQAADPARPVTDILFMSHGWKGDVPAAQDQYDRWMQAAAESAGLYPVRAAARGFRPLVVGLHWPSLPWGDEGAGAPAPSLLLGGDGEVERCAQAIADTPAARRAIGVILAHGQAGQPDAPLPAEVVQAYRVLAAEAGLERSPEETLGGGVAFDPAAVIADAGRHADGTPLVLAGPDRAGLRDVLLSPLRQLSFWTMKDRARRIGEGAVRDFLSALQARAPGARLHLMGHSFGCIVVSAAVAGTAASQEVRGPVDSLFLVQGALSLWAYAPSIPYAPGVPGYFARLLGQGGSGPGGLGRGGLVRGPVVATRSRFDTAVGRIYPLGAGVAGQYVLGEPDLPKYGGIGTFGIQGVDGARTLAIRPDGAEYGFRPGSVVTLDASEVIRNGGGVSGAHSDIAHPEVANAFWQAVLGSFEGRADAAPAPPPPAAPQVYPAEEYRPAAAPRPLPAPHPAPAAPRGGGLLGGLLGKWGGNFGFNSAVGTPDLAGMFSAGRSGQDDALAAAPAAPFQVPEPAAAPAPAPPEPAPKTATEPPGDPRWVNAWLDGHPDDAPLAVGLWYTLAFDVDIEARDGSLAGTSLNEEGLFAPGQTEVALTVQLTGPDFQIASATQTLVLPRAGRSQAARFGLSPRKEGRGRVIATILRDGNFIQQLQITLRVGGGQAAVAAVAAEGRPVSAAVLVQGRDLSLILGPSPGGFDCTLSSTALDYATLPLSAAYLDAALDAYRAELLKVVSLRDPAGGLPFQTGVDIPVDMQAAALPVLARAGARLFQKLFSGPGAGADSQRVGASLRGQLGAGQQPRTLQVISRGVPVPWPCLYLGDAAEGAALSWDLFLGFRHVIEQIPMHRGPSPPTTVMASDQPKLAVGLAVNAGIDAAMGLTVVADQDAYWQAASGRGKLTVQRRTTRQEVVQALCGTADQVLYFFCHAETAGLAAAGGPDASYLGLTDARLTLGDLSLDAPAEKALPGAPLVFINACESAALSSAFYDGFVPYFMGKGARGVVGTECNTPAIFAMQWARAFFDRFLAGEPIGTATLALRQEFLTRHGNPLGLLYAVHCDGDTRVSPAPV